MGIFAIGDIQGCYDELRQLLDQLNFDASEDQLWLVGDLVDRGPKSLETLRLIKNLGKSAITVLGNHDLHLLATYAGVKPVKPESSLNDVLRAPDCDELIHWLRHRDLLHHDPQLDITMVHAGLPPQWTLDTAQTHAKELEAVLRGDEYQEFLNHIYGNEPYLWSDHLQGWDRLRVITNALTRMRFCDVNGRLDMLSQGPPGSQPEGLIPWFEVPDRQNHDLMIISGHWAALGYRRAPGLIALDSGCVWGGKLTAIRLDATDEVVHTIRCPAYMNLHVFSQELNTSPAF